MSDIAVEKFIKWLYFEPKFFDHIFKNFWIEIVFVLPFNASIQGSTDQN